MRLGGFSLRPGLVVFAFLSLFGAVACHRDGGKGAFLDPAIGPLIPPDTTMMAGLRLEKIRATPLYKSYRDKLPMKMLEQFKERTGLDPEHDIWELVIAGTPNDYLVFARGRFTVGELEPKLDPLGKNRVSYKGYNLIGEERNAVVFLNPGVVVAGRMASLKTMIDRRDRPAVIPPALASRISSIPADAQLWLVDSGGLPRLDLLTNRDDVGSIVSNFVDYVSGANISVHVDEGVRFDSLIDCKSDEGVKRLKDALRGVIGFARLSTKGDQQDLLKLYDAIDVTAEQKAVRVTAAINPELVRTLLPLFNGLRGQGTELLAPGTR
jgi:hypothetical protein